MPAAGAAEVLIKREPVASHTPPPPPITAATAMTSSVAKRDHLRALLDRARAKTQTQRAGAALSTARGVTIKREPIVDDSGGSTSRLAAAVATALLPTPGATLVSASAGRSQDGLVPTETPVVRSYDAFRPISGEFPSVTAPSYHHNHHTGPTHPPPVWAPPTAFYATHPPSDSACQVAPANIHARSYPDESGLQWHYQAQPPPSVTIPTHTPHVTVDHAAMDRALTAHPTTVSPTMSATTSSSSSSTTKRRARPSSPSSSSSKTLPKRTLAVPKLSPGSVSSVGEYEDNELHSDFIHTIHMIIPTGSFGCLVGHRGESMKEINAASECTLSVRDESSFPMFESDRVLRIYGKPKGICLAQQIVIERIRNYRAHKEDSNYTDLGGKPMAPMTKTSVTRAISDAMEANDGEDAVEMAAEDGELRWLVHKDSVGKIMGQQGNILRAIAGETNTTIHVVPLQKMPPGSTERTVIITGEQADVKNAQAVIKSKAGGRLDTRGAGVGKSGQYFVIPQHVAGFLIGPNGTRIRKIRDETGARIQIAAQQDLPLGYVNRVVHFQGTSEQVEKAQSAIVRRLQSYMMTAEAKRAAAEDDIALQLVLPVRICSFLLDQRGRLIREISEKAGAYARFLPPIDEEHRVCVLYGDMPKVFRAERLVLQFIAGDAIANKWSTAGGAPPRKRKRVHNLDDESREDVDDMIDSDEPTPARGRAQKRHQVESPSDRIVVHYSTAKANLSQSRTRRGGAGRNKTKTQAIGKNSRRR